MRILQRGIPGTAMPSFGALSKKDRQTLVQYVQYLSIRGELERLLIVEVAMELDEGQRLVNWATREHNPDRFEEEVGWLKEIASEPMRRWVEADTQVTRMPDPPVGWCSEASVARGRDLFFTTLTNCAACHGETALGDGQTDDYGDWAKEFEPGKPAALRDYLALGALPPYKSQPRNLRLGVHRGGERPEDLFCRLRNGIAGTTMPKVAVDVTDEDVWHLIAYVLQLPEDPINRNE